MTREELTDTVRAGAILLYTLAVTLGAVGLLASLLPRLSGPGMALFLGLQLGCSGLALWWQQRYLA